MGRRMKATAAPFGENLRKIRLRLKMTQEEVAQRAGIARASVAKLELGTSRSARVETVHRIAKALGVAPSELVQYAPAQDLVREFFDSPLAEAINVTDNERKWLESLSNATWSGARPTPETVAQILFWYRSSRVK